MKIGAMFAGIGGLELALEDLGAETAWHMEKDPHASAVLARHWPGVPNHGDVTRVVWEEVAPVDVLTVGFPCQDISLAGRGAGLTGQRSGLWSYARDAIEHFRPGHVYVENVAALLGRGLPAILGDLAALGFDAEWGIVRASEVGAPHRRERLFLLATNPDGLRRREGPGLRGGGSTGDGGPFPRDHGGHPGLFAARPAPPAEGYRWDRYGPAVERWADTTRPAPSPHGRAGRLSADFVEWLMGFPEGWTVGLDRSDRLRLLGNAVVPQQGQAAFVELMARLHTPRI